MAPESDKDRSLDELAAEIGELVDETESMSSDLAREVGSTDAPGNPAREAEFFKSKSDSEDSLNAQFLQTDIAMHQTRQEIGLDPRGQADATPDADEAGASAPEASDKPATSAPAAGTTPSSEPSVEGDAQESTDPAPAAPDPQPTSPPPALKKRTKLALPPKHTAKPGNASEPAAATAPKPRPKPRPKPKPPARKEPTTGDSPAGRDRRIFGISVAAMRTSLPARAVRDSLRRGRPVVAACTDRLCRFLEALDRPMGWASPKTRQVCGMLALTLLGAAIFLYLFGVR